LGIIYVAEASQVWERESTGKTHKGTRQTRELLQTRKKEQIEVQRGVYAFDI
jgi:hypothetical protein